MKIYNTLTRKKEELVSIKNKEVSIYACGPTVYNYIHIGNARPICVFDVLRRYLKYKGNKVVFVQNFTDIDDKIINKAIEEKVDSLEISERYIKEYKKDAVGLNIIEPDMVPKVTENLDSISKMIEGLLEKGFAYKVDGDVYFRSDKFEEYGKLSKMPLDSLESGARVETGNKKESHLDFALWKKVKIGEPSWETSFGEGRPGWHIECSAMIEKIFGETIDIHCGGQDLIFPHHENEIAQSECYSGRELAKYWMHNGYINVNNKKMSKSLNNFFTVRDVAEKYGYEPIRFMMIQAHYRSPINYTIEVIESCVSSLERLYNFRDNIKSQIKQNTNVKYTDIQKQIIQEYNTAFNRCMDDDLNTSDALAVIFDMVRDINIYISDSDNISRIYLENILVLFETFTNILGILYNIKQEEDIPKEIKQLVEERIKYRGEKDYKKADNIRDIIEEKGYSIVETKQGTKIFKKN